MNETRVVRTCTRLTRKGRPCRRWALRGEPWCDRHHPLNAPVECIGGPWDGDVAIPGVGRWPLIPTTTPLFFRASTAELEALAGLPVVGTYHLVRRGDAFTFVWEQASGGSPPAAVPEGR